MDHLHGGDLLFLLGGLEAGGTADYAGASQHGLEQHQAQLYPADGESIQIERLAVKQVKESVIGLRSEVQSADITCDAGPIGTATEAHQRQNHPQEGA